jgi:hypothetical protein
VSDGNGKIPQESGNNGNPKVGYKSPPVHTRFKPGNCANPGGRPKGESLLSEIRDLLHGKGGKRRRAAAEAFLDQLDRGSLAHAKEIIEREEGKVPDRLAGADGEAIVVKVIKGVSIDDLR